MVKAVTFTVAVLFLAGCGPGPIGPTPSITTVTYSGGEIIYKRVGIIHQPNKRNSPVSLSIFRNKDRTKAASCDQMLPIADDSDIYSCQHQIILEVGTEYYIHGTDLAKGIIGGSLLSPIFWQSISFRGVEVTRRREVSSDYGAFVVGVFTPQVNGSIH